MKKLKLILAVLLLNFCLQAQDYNLGDRIEAEDKGQWFKATIARGKGGQHFKDGKYYIHWDGYAASYDVWIEPAKIRKPVANTVVATTNNAATNNATSNNAALKFKVGDKVTCLDKFCDGTIVDIKNGKYFVDFPDEWLNGWGKQGVAESYLHPQWKYRAFFEELKALQEGTAKTAKATTIIHLAAMVCADCSPNGNDNRDRTTAFVNDAKKELPELKALVKKYEPLPDNGNTYFHMNPAVVGKVAAESDKVIAELAANAFKDKIKAWFTAEMYFYDLTYDSFDTEHVLLNGVSFPEVALCRSVNDVKPALIKNLEACILKYGLTGKPEDYLKGYEENWATRKAKLEQEAADNSSFKSDYPIADNSLNTLLANPDNTGKTKIAKVLFTQAGYSVDKDEYGNITEQFRSGVAFYQMLGCSYWKWFPITAFKTYLGGGKYKATEVRFTDEKYCKPF
jgi:hypothetical protein